MNHVRQTFPLKQLCWACVSLFNTREHISRAFTPPKSSMAQEAKSSPRRRHEAPCLHRSRGCQVHWEVQHSMLGCGLNLACGWTAPSQLIHNGIPMQWRVRMTSSGQGPTDAPPPSTFPLHPPTRRKHRHGFLVQNNWLHGEQGQGNPSGPSTPSYS